MITGIADSLGAGSWAWPASYVVLALSAILAEVLLCSRPMHRFLNGPQLPAPMPADSERPVSA